MTTNSNNENFNKEYLESTSSLHHLMRTQIQSVIYGLHDQVDKLYQTRILDHNMNKDLYKLIVTTLNNCIKKLWVNSVANFCH